jgi:hypothetical protein
MSLFLTCDKCFTEWPRYERAKRVLFFGGVGTFFIKKKTQVEFDGKDSLQTVIYTWRIQVRQEDPEPRSAFYTWQMRILPAMISFDGSFLHNTKLGRFPEEMCVWVCVCHKTAVSENLSKPVGSNGIVTGPACVGGRVGVGDVGFEHTRATSPRAGQTNLVFSDGNEHEWELSSRRGPRVLQKAVAPSDRPIHALQVARQIARSAKLVGRCLCGEGVGRRCLAGV